jgi:hypothetical protein
MIPNFAGRFRQWRPPTRIAVAILGLFASFMLVQCGDDAAGPESPGGTPPNPGWRTWEDGIPADAGATFYLDPVAGRLDNPGTRAEPLPSLQAVTEADLIQRTVPTEYPWVDGAELEIAYPDAPILPGDTLVLLSGDHGPVMLRGSHADQWLTIRADTGARPVIRGLRLQGFERCVLQGLVIRGTGDDNPSTLLHLESHGWHGPCRYVVVEDCDLATVENATAWSAVDWDQRAANGIAAGGDYFSIRDNVLLNVDFGISVSGNYAQVERNRIENFSGDGLRGLGNDMVFAANTVMNCYDVNDNHDDGFQSWSINDDPPRERVELRDNVIINYTDPDQPHRGALQGIGCFDGMYVDWIVENNVVMTDHWHGITLSGAIGCRVVNNTVVDLNHDDPGEPWISVGDHKDGTPSRNCLIRNNVARVFLVGAGVTADHNLESTDYEALFVDHAGGDLRPRDGSALVDAGSADQAPAVDVAGAVRPQGAAVDIGAYER